LPCSRAFFFTQTDAFGSDTGDNPQCLIDTEVIEYELPLAELTPLLQVAA
jgi:hypothetical protein